MPSLRKRGDKWQVQVRRTGCLPVSRSFAKKADALRWANQMELKADRRDLALDTRKLDRLTVSDLLERYRDEIVPSRRSSDVDTWVVNAMLRASFAKQPVGIVTPATFATYRDSRLKIVSPATVARELRFLRQTFDLARNEWDVPLSSNPVTSVKVKGIHNARDRRLRKGEFTKLMRGARKCRNKHVRPLILFALETAMRMGELLRIEPAHVNLEKRTLLIPLTKNGEPRIIALTKRAVRILRHQFERGNAARAFPTTQDALKNAWQRLMARTSIKDLHFHDLRHEGVSRLFERGLTIPEVALISGHKDPRMLFRYTHLRAEDVVRKLT